MESGTPGKVISRAPSSHGRAIVHIMMRWSNSLTYVGLVGLEVGLADRSLGCLAVDEEGHCVDLVEAL
eukprot:6408424-Heterocapsa_arctica.AAC.1